MQDLLKELDGERLKKKKLADAASKRTQDLEQYNAELANKVEEEENAIREHMNLIKNLKNENDKADQVIRELERQSDLNKDELQRIKDEIEDERRRTIVNEEEHYRRLKKLEEEKKKMEEKIRAGGQKEKDYEGKIRKMAD